MEHRDARSLSPDARRALRGRAIRAVEHAGLSKAAAARAYRRDGPAALAGAARGRRPKPLLTPDQAARLRAALTAEAPDEAGLAETPWTRAAVGDWAARERTVRRSRRVWGRRLRAKGLPPQKPARHAYQRASG
jgi:transposase